MKITIDVTQGCIDVGYKGEPSLCPIALAIKTHPAIITTDVKVNNKTLKITNDNLFFPLRRTYRIKLSAIVQNFIIRFDYNGTDEKIKPFTFTINIPLRFIRFSYVSKLALQKLAALGMIMLDSQKRTRRNY